MIVSGLARVAPTSSSPVIVVCVLNHGTVRSILDADALEGRTLVNRTGVVGGPEAALLYSGPDGVYRARLGRLLPPGRAPGGVHPAGWAPGGRR